MVNYILIFCILLFLEVLYLKVAKINNIKDSPNHRSAHVSPTIRGGGIVVFFSVFLFLFFYDFSLNFVYFLSGIILVSTVSFVDDLFTISSKSRLIIHFVAISLIFYSFQLFNIVSVMDAIILLAAYLFSIGFLNVYNFMDGINGMTFLNGLVSYLTLLYLNHYFYNFTDSNLLIVLIFAILIFGFFNFRVRAICFAGDIGSIAVGFSLIYFVLKFFLETYNPLVFLIFLVYLLDGGLTLIERAMRKENIFEAHKRHLYQLAVNDFKISHLKVSVLYFLVQFIINLSLLFIIDKATNQFLILIIAVLGSSICYGFIKYKVINHLNRSYEN